jgi:hypothetical protein
VRYVGDFFDLWARIWRKAMEGECVVGGAGVAEERRAGCRKEQENMWQESLRKRREWDKSEEGERIVHRKI